MSRSERRVLIGPTSRPNVSHPTPSLLKQPPDPTPQASTLLLLLHRLPLTLLLTHPRLKLPRTLKHPRPPPNAPPLPPRQLLVRPIPRLHLLATELRASLRLIHRRPPSSQHLAADVAADEEAAHVHGRDDALVLVALVDVGAHAAVQDVGF